MLNALSNWEQLIRNLIREQNFRVEETDQTLRIISSDQDLIQRLSDFIGKLTPDIFEESRPYHINNRMPKTGRAYRMPRINNIAEARAVFNGMFDEDVFVTLNPDTLFALTNKRDPKNVAEFIDGKLISVTYKREHAEVIWQKLLENIYNAFHGITIEQAQASLHGASLTYQKVQLKGKQIKTLLTECFYLLAPDDQLRFVVDFKRFLQFLWAPRVTQTQEQGQFVATLDKEHFLAYLRQLSGGGALLEFASDPISGQVQMSPLLVSNTPSVVHKNRIVVLADCSDSIGEDISILREKLCVLRDNMLEHFPAAELDVIFFNDVIKHRFNYPNISRIAEGQMEKDMQAVSPLSMTALYSSIQTVLEEIYQASLITPSNTIFIVFTDGLETMLKQDSIPNAQEELKLQTQRFEQVSRSRPKCFTIGLGDSYDEDVLRMLATLSNGEHFHIDDMKDLLLRLFDIGNIGRMRNLRQILDVIVRCGATDITYNLPVRLVAEPQKTNIIVPVPRDRSFQIKIGDSNFDVTLAPERLLTTAMPPKPVAGIPRTALPIETSPLESLDTSIPSAAIEVKEKIGEGGYGYVHRATYQGKTVAVKVLRKGNYSPDAVAELRQEAMLMNRVGNCSNVVRVFGLCIEPDKYSLVMEYMEGGDLFHLLYDKNNDLSWLQRLNYAGDVARGLWFIHDHGILHRDLKSANVLLTADRKIAKISDLGLGLIRAEGAVGTIAVQTDHIYGTLCWMAPESLQDKPVYNKRTDSYSFTMVCYELLTRQTPFAGAGNEVILAIPQGRRPDIPAEAERAQPKFAALIRLGWAQDPNVRPTARGFIEEIDECIKECPRP